MSAVAASDLKPDSLAFNRTYRYAFEMEYKASAITGTFIAKTTDDALYGSVVNDFGISVLDFSYSFSKDKVRMINVVSFLNKWYVKRTIKADLKYCLHVVLNIPLKENGKYIVTNDGPTVTVFNMKRKIKYVFAPFTIATQQDDTQE